MAHPTHRDGTFRRSIWAPAPLSLSANIFSLCLSDYDLHSRWLLVHSSAFGSVPLPVQLGWHWQSLGLGYPCRSTPKSQHEPTALLVPERPSSVLLQTRREFLTLSGDVKAQRPLPGQVWSGHSSSQAQENFRFLIPSELLAPLSRL